MNGRARRATESGPCARGSACLASLVVASAVAGCTGRHSDASTPDVGVPIDARVSDAGARRVLFYPGIDCNPIADQRCLEPPSPISDEERFTSAPATEMEPPAGTEVVLSVRPIGD